MNDDELALARRLLDLLSKASPDIRSRVVRMLVTLILDDGAVSNSRSHRLPSEELKSASRELQLPRFSEDRTLSPKEFILEKRPQSDVERIACLAYYLAHYRDQAEFKTRDLTALNQESGQPRMGNPTQATDNATKGGYLINGSRGFKQISALGEQFVQALPDRDAARNLYREHSVRRRPAKRRTTKATR